MKKIIFAASLFALPLVAGAQNIGGPDFGYFGTILVSIRGLLDTVIPILIGLGLIVFFWGLIKYIRNTESEEGKRIMIAGLVGLFVMVSVWGIIRLAQQVLRIQSNDAAGQNVQAPNIPR